MSDVQTIAAFPTPHPCADTSARRAIILIRVAVGVVFLSEGIQEFLYPHELGAGRFTRIGIPAPEVMAPLVGALEIVCGSLVQVGFLTRLAAIPLVINMLVAIASTKVPILLGHGYFRFANPSADGLGLWSMLHESRTDLSMLLGSIFLFVVGAGAWSVDALLESASRHPLRGNNPEPFCGRHLCHHCVFLYRAGIGVVRTCANSGKCLAA